MSVTPDAIEKRLIQLSKEVDEAHTELVHAETMYHKAKAEYEIAIARERLRLLGVTGLRVQDVADKALVACAGEYAALQTAEAIAKAARGNSQRLRTQVDIARSIGTSVRASLEL